MRNNAIKQSGRMLKVLLPYCEETEFPEAACTMYRLPGEMSSFVNDVHNLSDLVQKFIFLCSRKNDNELIKLSKELSKAEHELKKHTSPVPVPIQEIEEVNIEIGLDDFSKKLESDSDDAGNDTSLEPMMKIGELMLSGGDNDNNRPQPRTSSADRSILNQMEI